MYKMYISDFSLISKQRQSNIYVWFCNGNGSLWTNHDLHFNWKIYTNIHKFTTSTDPLSYLYHPTLGSMPL